jgi:hypothetical protein
MSQRDSGYARRERDLYETPAWATEALLPHLPRFAAIWEPAAATGKMARVLAGRAETVISTDIDRGDDFLASTHADEVEAIITNPPYELATEFIDHALKLMASKRGLVAMLLRTDFDHAKSRAYLFAGCPAFSKKIVLTKRIRWFEDSKGSPSFNHCWMIWDHRHSGAPTLAYAP